MGITKKLVELMDGTIEGKASREKAPHLQYYSLQKIVKRGLSGEEK